MKGPTFFVQIHQWSSPPNPMTGCAASGPLPSSSTSIAYLTHEDAETALDWLPKLDKIDGQQLDVVTLPSASVPGDINRFLDTQISPNQIRQYQDAHSPVKYRQLLPPESFRVTVDDSHDQDPNSPKAKTYHCNQCDYSSHLFGNLKTHFRQHTKEKPFACSLCDYRARQQSNLKTHMRKHTGEKPYSCEFCPYKSSQHSNLKIHRMQHTGDRPFVCPVCSKKFSRHGYFHSHFTLHQEESQTPCPYC